MLEFTRTRVVSSTQKSESLAFSRTQTINKLLLDSTFFSASFFPTCHLLSSIFPDRFYRFASLTSSERGASIYTQLFAIVEIVKHLQITQEDEPQTMTCWSIVNRSRLKWYQILRILSTILQAGCFCLLDKFLETKIANVKHANKLCVKYYQ